MQGKPARQELDVLGEGWITVQCITGLVSYVFISLSSRGNTYDTSNEVSIHS